MIVEVCAACATVCFCATLRFAKWSVKCLDELDARNVSPRRLTKEGIEEKRRVLERDREEWKKGFGNPDANKAAIATKQVQLIDQQLLALADELRE